MSQCTNHQRFIKITNPKCGFVLDGSDYEVTIEKYKGKPGQQWRLECAEYGRFFIINRETGLALDVEGGIEEGATLITYEKHGEINQQWYINSDGTIESPSDDGLCVDIDGAKYSKGNNLIIYPKHCRDNQIFEIEYV